MLLLKAGASDRHPHVLAPAGFRRIFGIPRSGWCFEMEPGPGVNGGAILLPQDRKRCLAGLHAGAGLHRAPRRGHHRMGTDVLAAVAPRPRGVAGLRAANASANTSAATMMIAERAAATVLAECSASAPAAA